MNENLSQVEKNFLSDPIRKIGLNISIYLESDDYELNKSIPIYCWLLKEFEDKSVPLDTHYIFQIVFSSFYGLRFQKKEWKKKYFSVMQKFREVENVAIETIILELHKEESESIQFSFITKMLNLINQNNPIFDINVSRVLKLGEIDYKKKESVIDTYSNLFSVYKYLHNDSMMREYLTKFDNAFNAFNWKIGEVKKIDFLLWCAGKPAKNP
jgi:hypothetical protein